MPFAVEAVVMIGNDQARVQGPHPRQTGREFFGATVEKGRREMGAEPVAGEKVARKKKMEAFAIKAAMARRVAGKRNDAQPAPVRKLGLGHERQVDGDGPVAKQAAADRLHEAAETAWARVRKGAVDVGLFEGMGQDGRAGEFLEPGEIAGVIEVAVGEKDGPDVGGLEADLAQRSQKPGPLADQPGVDQDGFAPGGIVEEMKRAGRSTEGMEAKGGGGLNIV